MGLASGFESSQAQASGLTIQWLGHMCFLLTGGGRRVLVNPFRTLGCTAGYRLPKVATDLVLISSQLLDEGAIEILPGNPRLLYEPGSFQVDGTSIQGIRTDHDRIGGKQFGTNVAWQWKQAGITILHLGGTAAAISDEQHTLMGRPDVVMIPVGGGSKAYTPEEARDAIAILQPKIVIPMYYQTKAASASCTIGSVDDFLSKMNGVPVHHIGDSISLSPRDLPAKDMVIQLMSYRF
jgi:L-ascorbate metabolism protein UlaG (beta-lactamase superfamily)